MRQECAEHVITHSGPENRKKKQVQTRDEVLFKGKTKYTKVKNDNKIEQLSK